MRSVLFFTVVVLSLIATACAYYNPFAPQLFKAPVDQQHQKIWLAELDMWRASVKREINYTGTVYDDLAVNWTRTSYVQPQTHLYDRYLYDPDKNQYTVERYLDDVDRRYGGIDSILLWPTYPNIGIDDRNQFDYFRALPGGISGLTSLISEFKQHGVRVMLAYNPWDQGTHDEGEEHWDTLADFIKETNSDGFNGDTMTTMYNDYWNAGVKRGHKFVGEMEMGGYPNLAQARDRTWESANWDPMGWGEGFQSFAKWDNITMIYETAPGIDRAKWLDGRRMTHIVDRWQRNKTDTLHYAFFNGDGFVSWENVWGVFMGLTPRDGEALRRVATLFRWLGPERFIQDYAKWEPYTPDLHREAATPFEAGGLMASKFVRHDGDCVWLIVNRASIAAFATIDVSGCKHDHSQQFDLYHGQSVRPALGLVRLELEPFGFGALLSTKQVAPVQSLLQTMRQLTSKPLATYDSAWVPLQQTMVGMQRTELSVRDPLAGMIPIPRTIYRFRTAGVEIEGGCDSKRDTWGICCKPWQMLPRCPGAPGCGTSCAFADDDNKGVDAQFPWEAMAGRFHDNTIDIGPFYIDKHLVTRGDYAKYLQSSGYTPRDAKNFLRGWDVGANSTLTPSNGTEQWPVTSVSLDEARLYCKSAGKRLPHTYEWQLAAQGTDGRTFPWGNSEGQAGVHFPKPSAARTVPPLPDVGSHAPAGDSVYGMSDIVGFVWQYTDEFRDEHTRSALLKGSSVYTPMLSGTFPAQPQVGNWYFPKAPELDRHNRMLLMSDSYERATTLGFRCVADHPDGKSAPFHLETVSPASSARVLV